MTRVLSFYNLITFTSTTHPIYLEQSCIINILPLDEGVRVD